MAEKVSTGPHSGRRDPGGQLKENYVFQWANDGKVGKSVKFSELFADKNTLCFTHLCTVRTGTIPVLPVRRWSMGLIAPGTKSVKAEPRLSQLPRPWGCLVDPLA
jgi:hypothetical protein